MLQYKDLVNHVLHKGVQKEDRTGVGTLSVFGYQMRFDLQEGFPLLNLKQTLFRPIKEELLWFLRGETNIKTLNAKIWDEWADENGELGAIYGAQWRSWGAGNGVKIDQIAKLIQALKNNPFDRGHIVNAWNVGELNKMALRPCHAMFQLAVIPLSDEQRLKMYKNKGFGIEPFKIGESHTFKSNGKIELIGQLKERVYFHTPTNGLSLQLYQRSADIGLGVPFNIASYALLTHMFAEVLGYKPLEFIHTLGDAHIYLNHVEGLRECIQRETLPLPKLILNPMVKDIDGFRSSDIFLTGNTEQHARIKLEVAV